MNQFAKVACPRCDGAGEEPGVPYADEAAPVCGECGGAGLVTVAQREEREVFGFGAVIVLLTLSGATIPDAAALVGSIPGIRAVDWVRVEREGEAVCIAARVRSSLPSVLAQTAQARTWGASNGWGVTVAPVS